MAIPVLSGLTPLQPLSPEAVSPTAGSGPSEAFNNAVIRAVDHLNGLQHTADATAVQAATGRLTDVHDYMIAATQAQVTTELTVAVRNKAVEAFNEIMRMQV